MAYVLGFFAADGTITKNKNNFPYFVLQIRDRVLLTHIRATIGSNHKISKRVHRKNNGIFYRIQIGNTQIYKDLLKMGFSLRKTERLRVPKIPIRYFPDFVRGYFDGDGNVWTGFVHKDREKKTYVINTTLTSCSREFLNTLHMKLKGRGIKGGSIYKRKSNAYCLRLSVKDSILLYHLIYDTLGNEMFLKRKKGNFDKFLRRRNK